MKIVKHWIKSKQWKPLKLVMLKKRMKMGNFFIHFTVLIEYSSKDGDGMYQTLTALKLKWMKIHSMTILHYVKLLKHQQYRLHSEISKLLLTILLTFQDNVESFILDKWV